MSSTKRKATMMNNCIQEGASETKKQRCITEDRKPLNDLSNKPRPHVTNTSDSITNHNLPSKCAKNDTNLTSDRLKEKKHSSRQKDNNSNLNSKSPLNVFPLSLLCSEKVEEEPTECQKAHTTVPNTKCAAVLMCKEGLTTHNNLTIEKVQVAIKTKKQYTPPKRTCSFFIGDGNFFEMLPDEIVLIIFKHFENAGTRKQLFELRVICKRWSNLIQDKSLRLPDTDEEIERFRAMLNNERKHFAKVADYLTNNAQNEISRGKYMRAILVDWLVDVVSEFKLNRDTLFLCVFYVDRYLSASGSLARNKLQLLELFNDDSTRKYDEIYAPCIEDLVYICDGAYTAEEILSMEIHVLNCLQFEVTVCTSQRFLDYFLKAASKSLFNEKVGEDTEKLNNLSQYLIELSLLDYRFIRYSPSVVSTAAVCLALHGTSYPNWEKVLVDTTYTRADIQPCMTDLLDLHKRVPTLLLRSVPTKFSSMTHGAISNLRIPDITLL